MQMNPLLGSTFAAIAAVSCAGIVHAGLATSQAIVVDISCQFIGMPGYEGLQTFRIYLQFTSASDSLFNHTNWNVDITGGTFFNLDPGPVVGPSGDDPLGLIGSGDVPLPPGLFQVPGYAAWAWDSNLSMDNSQLSQTEPVFTWTDTHIGPAGVFVSPPSPTAGDDLLIQVAQLTFSAGTPIVKGTFIALTPSSVAGATPTQIHFPLDGFFVFDVADLNYDFCVDGLDLGILLANWSIPAGSPGCGGDFCCTADLNHDGVVDALDLGILLAHWQPFCD